MWVFGGVGGESFKYFLFGLCIYVCVCVFVLNVVGLFSKTLCESEVFQSLHETSHLQASFSYPYVISKEQGHCSHKTAVLFCQLLSWFNEVQA